MHAQAACGSYVARQRDARVRRMVAAIRTARAERAFRITARNRNQAGGGTLTVLRADPDICGRIIFVPIISAARSVSSASSRPYPHAPMGPRLQMIRAPTRRTPPQLRWANDCMHSTAPHAMAPIWRDSPTGEAVCLLEGCPLRRTTRPAIPGITPIKCSSRSRSMAWSGPMHRRIIRATCPLSVERCPTRKSGPCLRTSRATGNRPMCGRREMRSRVT